MLLPNEHITAYASPVAAQISLPSADTKTGATHAIVEAQGTAIAAPKANGKLAPEDLRLVRGATGWSPKNTNVNTELPGDLGSPVVLGGANPMQDVRIRIGGAGVTGAPTADGRHVFYANSNQDTDAVIQALPLGAEISWNLRSPAAPQSLPLDVQVPPGSSFVKRDDGSIELIDNDATIAQVGAPTAHDAQGRPVTVRLTRFNGGVAVQVQHRGRDLAYPIAVDPYFNFYGVAGIKGANPWDGLPETATGVWQYWDAAGSIVSNPIQNLGNGYLSYDMHTKTNLAGAGNAGWEYDPPGNSTVFRAEFKDAAHTVGAPSTRLDAGEWHGGNGWGETAWAGWVDGAG